MPVPCQARLRDTPRPTHRSSARTASLRVGSAIGLLLVALSAVATKAAAMGPRVIVDDPPAEATPPNQVAIGPSESFDWSVVGIGACFTVALTLLVGGALVLSRRRARRRIAADYRH
jgi:hypothetical protein